MSSARDLVGIKAGTLLEDDFISNDLVTDNNIGQLGWQLANIANAPALAYQTATRHGVLRITTAATANGDGGVLHLFPDGLVVTPGVQFGARIRYPIELASLNFRIGLDDSVTATRPTVGVTLESDAGVLSCHADSADHGDNARTVIGHPDLTGGTTMVVAEWVDVEARCAGRPNAQGGPSEVDFFINGRSVATVPSAIDDDEEVEPKIVVWQDSGSADAVAFEIDHYWLWIPRT